MLSFEIKMKVTGQIECNEADIVNTSAATILSSDHGRMRRAQRMIDKRDLQAAVKYGVKERSYNTYGVPRWKYTFADIVYITDDTSRREITSWAKPGVGLNAEKRTISDDMKTEHKIACDTLSHNQANWTSHTVIVVDQSGSMRKFVEGGATRSDAVWLTIAIDFVAKQINEGKSCATDVVSIVAMGRTSRLLIDRKPHDWLLFNKVIDLLRSEEPYFDGNYIPSIDVAEMLLLSNTYGSCALTLFFFSDGKPSDKLPPGTYGGYIEGHSQLIGDRIESLASRFGRRLTVMTVGFADYEDFSVLIDMARRPKRFQSKGSFFAAKLNPEALGEAFSSLSSSLNQTRSELTAIGATHQRSVRNVLRKPMDLIGVSLIPDDDWYTYESSTRCLYSHKNPKDEEFTYAPPLHENSCGVALSKRYFGEGAERIVREFREVGKNGLFVGPMLVAKESRFQVDVEHTDRDKIYKFHRTFCNTQERAQGLANVFNEWLEKLPCYDPKSTPKISFLSCSVYVVHDRNLGEMGALVEKQLNPSKYKKWNDNCGGVNGQVLQEDTVQLNLDAIIEESEEENDDDSDYDGDSYEENTEDYKIDSLDVPQAFSHFTYRFTKRRLLVCDLQGVLNTDPPLFELTDPVIHFRSKKGYRNHLFGRTNRGRKGINDFFRTHTCTPLCRMLWCRWAGKIDDKQRSSHLTGLEESVSNLQFGTKATT